MKINKLNYENFVIDYIEGTLSIELKKDFDLFLEKNEEVYEEIKDYISAPILEESDEVFLNKKSLKQRTTLNPYLLLILIPFLLIGSYLLIPESNTKVLETQIETKATIHQFAQEEKKVHKQELVVKPMVETKKETKLKSINEKEEKEIQVVKTKKEPQIFFASSDRPEKISTKDHRSSSLVKQKINELSKKEMMNSLATLEVLPIKTLDSDINHYNVTIGLTSLASKEKTLIDQLTEKSSWMEMVTPASFEDLDLKESLAIESNDNINTRRKILNAFIPASLVK